METIILGGRAFAFAGAVGTDLIFNAVRSTSCGIINGMNYIYSSDKSGISHLKFELDKIDLLIKVNIVDSFIHELDNTKISNSVKSSLISVENILFKLKKEIDDITNLIKDHNEKWFAYWRYLDYTAYLENIKIHNNILDKRLDLLLKLLQVDQNTIKH